MERAEPNYRITPVAESHVEKPRPEEARRGFFERTASGLRPTEWRRSSRSWTLLGLWWVVIQVRYKDAAATPALRRHAYGVLVFFLMPGMMSLFSIVDDAGTWWRVVFGWKYFSGIGLIDWSSPV